MAAEGRDDDDDDDDDDDEKGESSRAALWTGRPGGSPPRLRRGLGEPGPPFSHEASGAKVDAFLLGVDHWVVKRVSSALAKLGLTGRPPEAVRPLLDGHRSRA